MIASAPRVRGRAAAGAPPRTAADRWTLIFDGECAFCRGSIELLRGWDKSERLSFVPFQDSGALALFPKIPRAELAQAMHLVAPDGGVFKGATALPAILRLIPGGAPLALLCRMPGVPWLLARAYRQIARSRHHLDCGSSTCTLDGR